MRKLEPGRYTAISSASPCEDVIASVAKDFLDLAAILARFRPQHLDLDHQQLHCIARANEAAARGIELSKRLSHGSR
jgi:hypothetical protein